MLGSDVACNLDYCSCETVAEGVGGRGFHLERGCSKQEIRDAL